MIDESDNTVIVCMDFVKGKCHRDNKCKYYHPEAHLIVSWPQLTSLNLIWPHITPFEPIWPTNLLFWPYCDSCMTPSTTPRMTTRMTTRMTPYNPTKPDITSQMTLSDLKSKFKNEIKHRQSLLSSHLHAQNSNTMHFKDQPVRFLDRPVHRNLTSNSDLTRCIIPSISNPDFSSPRTSPGRIIWPESHMTHDMSHLIWLRF